MTRRFKTLSISVGLCVIGLGLAPPILAQSDVAIRQAPSPAVERSSKVDASQVGTVPTSTAPMAVAPVERSLGGSAPSISPSLETLQISPGTVRTDPGAQLGPSDPGPVPSAPARSLAEGRITAVTTLQGADRCDPQSRQPTPRNCADVIETRARDFAETGPRPLSAEQELMARQRDQPMQSVDVGSAARRLANGQIDESTTGVIVAAQTMQSLNQQPEERIVAEPSALDAIVAGITTLITGQPHNP
jgi:hypothetical protein